LPWCLEGRCGSWLLPRRGRRCLRRRHRESATTTLGLRLPPPLAAASSGPPSRRRPARTGSTRPRRGRGSTRAAAPRSAGRWRRAGATACCRTGPEWSRFIPSPARTGGLGTPRGRCSWPLRLRMWEGREMSITGVREKGKHRLSGIGACDTSHRAIQRCTSSNANATYFRCWRPTCTPRRRCRTNRHRRCATTA
jgi:hypothetical protein